MDHLLKVYLTTKLTFRLGLGLCVYLCLVSWNGSLNSFIFSESFDIVFQSVVRLSNGKSKTWSYMQLLEGRVKYLLFVLT